MNVADLLAEIQAPDSAATINERDAAAELARLINCGRAVGPAHLVPAEMVYGYYSRVHQGQMSTHLSARGA